MRECRTFRFMTSVHPSDPLDALPFYMLVGPELREMHEYYNLLGFDIFADVGDILSAFRHLSPEAVVKTPFVFKLPPRDAYFTQRYQERRACSIGVGTFAS